MGPWGRERWAALKIEGTQRKCAQFARVLREVAKPSKQRGPPVLRSTGFETNETRSRRPRRAGWSLLLTQAHVPEMVTRSAPAVCRLAVNWASGLFSGGRRRTT